MTSSPLPPDPTAPRGVPPDTDVADTGQHLAGGTTFPGSPEPRSTLDWVPPPEGGSQGSERGRHSLPGETGRPWTTQPFHGALFSNSGPWVRDRPAGGSTLSTPTPRDLTPPGPARPAGGSTLSTPTPRDLTPPGPARPAGGSTLSTPTPRDLTPPSPARLPSLILGISSQHINSLPSRWRRHCTQLSRHGLTDAPSPSAPPSLRGERDHRPGAGSGSGSARSSPPPGNGRLPPHPLPPLASILGGKPATA
ncbi:basic salivary proline-rich protein 3-like [Pristis pectinata]|uniref:basic salivary proline-rich protein 3-like n=1 Tax=Pristis pectinata TaxID=685728 RepID=UPI00223DDE8A|nr:basic salivary proline-rich protein 3-like [Pristis pectinata]